jgi:lipoprotein-anchoring transpeptidase ErfK/SrfK
MPVARSRVGLSGRALSTKSTLLVAAACIFASGPLDAQAETERRKRVPRAKVKLTQSAPAPAPIAAVKGPLLAVVAIGEQKFTLYSGTEVVATSRISSGKRGHPTPTGVFSIIQKNRFHRSNIYSGAPMPFMQRITWSGIALHAGVLPGYPASHGCIRLPNGFAASLFGTTKMGTRVVVASTDVRPTAFSHPGLPVPTLIPAPPGAQQATAGPTAALKTGTTTDASGDLLDPMKVGEIEKMRLAAESVEARRNVPIAFAAAEKAAREHDASLAALRDAQRVLGEERAAVAAVERLVASARTETERVEAEARGAAASAAVSAAEDALSRAREAENRASDRAMDAAIAAKAAEDMAETAQDAARVGQKRTEPITILVSRKEQKVYVRQGWETVLESEAKVADPSQSIGTHVFMVSAAQITGEGKPDLTWKALHVPDSANGHDTHERALERISLPEAAAREISARLWTGATLMISDNGPGNETGKYTDLIVQTR